MTAAPHSPNPIVVGLTGDLDFASVDDAAERIAQAIASGRDVTVDMGDVPFIDSTGIGMLVRACRQAHKRGHSFSVTGLQPFPMRSLQITGALDVLCERPRSSAH